MNFARANLKKLISIPLFFLGWLLSWCVPRNPHSWVFGSGIGVGEGALVIARELRSSQPEALIHWIVGNEAQAELASSYGFHPHRRTHAASLWATLRAGHIVVTHGFGDVNRFGIFRGEVTHLIHGAPMKRLHLDSPATTQITGPRILSQILSRMYRAGTRNITLMVAGSQTAAERLRTAYALLPGKVQVLGDARDDVIIKHLTHPESAQRAKSELWARISPASDSTPAPEPKTLILYAPTWRDGDPDPAIPDAHEIAAIQAFCESQNAHLVIRSHPLGMGNYDGLVTDRIHLCDSNMIADMNEYLISFDLLITDYSSIAIDYSLLERPIIWFAPDLERYTRERGLYEPLEVTAVGKVVSSWEAVLNRMTQVNESGSMQQRIAIQDAQHLKRRFYPFGLTAAAPRVLEAIHRLSLPDDELIDPQGIYFESFYGRNASCNPKALDREIATHYPQRTRYWSVSSERVTVPDGATPVLVGSREWNAVRNTVPLLIVNDWLRFHFVRGAHQTVVQTWHGTMLKHLALERPNVSMRTRFAIRRESKRWSLLLSENPHSTEYLRKSYAYPGEILELGYPRTDVLAQSLAGTQRSPIVVAAARRRLGIPEGASVLSYAPTWRDGSDELVNTIEVEQLLEELGPDWIVVARAHTRSAAGGSYGGANSRIIDASRYPDINDVLIASDVFVTDYSSAMFDASVARIPTLFFVPDQAEYRDVSRGFTFDFDAVAPGPLCTTRAEIVRYAHETQQYGVDAPWAASYQKRISEFRSRFNPLDDGAASSRVLAALEERGVLLRS